MNIEKESKLPRQQGDQNSVSQPTPTPTSMQQEIGCTLEAKICPNGSSVGRSGPKCEFAACPE